MQNMRSVDVMQNVHFVLRSILKETTAEIRIILDATESDWIKRYRPLYLVRQTAQSMLDDVENLRSFHLHDPTSYLMTDAATWRAYVEKYDGKSKPTNS